MDFCTGEREYVLSLHRGPVFDKCLETLRSRGGEAQAAAAKIDAFIDLLLNPGGPDAREKFRFTRTSETRIRNCKKIDLGCGFRLVCVKEGGRLALLYAGTHDDCFRWIELNKGFIFDFSATPGTALAPAGLVAGKDPPPDVPAEQCMLDDYEALLMSRINDEILRKVFFGLCQRPQRGQSLPVGARKAGAS